MLTASVSDLGAAMQGAKFFDQLTIAEKARIGVASMAPEQLAALEAAFLRIVTSQNDAATAGVVSQGMIDCAQKRS